MSPFDPLPAPVADGERPAGRRFCKEIARVGAFAHPDGELAFTPERLAAWLEAFRQARQAGIQIPVPLNHGAEPTDNAGWVEELELSDDGERLFAVLVITRPEVAELIESGTIRHTSLALGPLADDAGRYWEEAILEVSLVTEPHIRRQGPFVNLTGVRELAVELAASRRRNVELSRSLDRERFRRLQERVDRLIAGGQLAPDARADVVALAAALPGDEERERLFASYARPRVSPGALTTPSRRGGTDPELEAVARRFG
ncbi:MAG TPA: hypothetical protein ENN88_03120, partial [Candidatus Coatesbacteria bacterium]|nr:hypothetical protein [Candidatus Coatesbacteria bacterium]